MLNKIISEIINEIHQGVRTANADITDADVHFGFPTCVDFEVRLVDIDESLEDVTIRFSVFRE